jgi:hypothetical protein
MALIVPNDNGRMGLWKNRAHPAKTGMMCTGEEKNHRAKL